MSNYVCKEPLWNRTYSWDSPHPDFTNCFEQIVLIGGSCAFLWVLLPWQIYAVLSDSGRLGRWTRMTIAKQTLCVILAILELMDLGYTAQILVHFGGDALPSINMIAPLIQVFTFLLAMIYIDLDRRKGRPSNPVMSLFWLLLAVSSGIVLRTKVLKAVGVEPKDADDIFGLFTFELYFPLVIAQLLLSCFADDYPERFENWTKNPSPENNASWLNVVFAHWITELFREGWKRELTKDDIWDLIPEERSENLGTVLTENWMKQLGEQTDLPDTQSVSSSRSGRLSERLSRHSARRSYGSTALLTPPTASAPAKDKKPSLTMALYKTFWQYFWKSALAKVFYDAAAIIVPVLVGELIAFVAQVWIWSWRGYVYAALLGIAALMQSIGYANMNFVSTRLGMRVRSALAGMIFRKALKLSNTSKRHFPVGDVVNLLTLDVQRICDFLYYHHYVWITPFTILVIMYVLWLFVGVASLAGFFTLVFLIILNFALVGRSKKFEMAAAKQKNNRVRRINEIFNGIKILKMYAWESRFQELIIAEREEELSSINKAGILLSICNALNFVMSPLAALATYTTYVYLDTANQLTADVAFVTLIFLFSLRHTLFFIPVGATLLVQARIAIQKLTAFFLARELDKDSVERLEKSDSLVDSAVTIMGGNFSWNPRFATSQQLALKNINLSVKHGELFAVVGGVGSGKTSLLAAMLGLMERISGHVTLQGTVAYVTQSAWIQNLTVRDNILFGKPYDEERYLDVLETCALKPDLEILTDGDQTEIGEKGMNLSGGQKLRMTLARAVYSDADIIFLDDPLSAVDAHVGRHIFEQVIGPNGALRDKTRIFVTNAINWLPACDRVAYLEQGRISELGTYEELADRDERFGDYLRQCELPPNGDGGVAGGGAGGLDPDSTNETPVAKREKPLDRDHELAALRRKASQRPPDGNISQSMEAQPVRRRKKAGESGEAAAVLMSAEQYNAGVKWGAYGDLLRDMSWLMTGLLILGYFVGNAFFLVSNLWIVRWCSVNLTVLAEAGNALPSKSYEPGMYSLWIVLQFLFMLIGITATSLGMVRASRSLHNDMLIRLLKAPMWYFDTTPLGRIVNRFSKDMDLVDNGIPTLLRFVLNSFSQAIVFFLMILVVFPLITALLIPLAAVAYFVKNYATATLIQLKRIDVLSRAPMISILQEAMSGSSIIVSTQQTERFIAENHKKVDHLTSVLHCSNVSLQWLTLQMEFLINILTFFVAIFAVFGRDSLGYDAQAAAVGMGLLACVTLTTVFPWFTQNFCDLENAMISVERLREYSNAPSEAPAIIPNHRPPAKWPYFGNIAFTDYQARYREGLDLALDGITGTINSGEKIGVVGRTGSGKSTLTLAILRLIEPAGGTIYIDGTDISRIGLHDLRSRITIIPQDAVLFSGSLRMNLDPFDTATDEELWRTLESSRLKTYFKASSHGLNFRVTEGGSNLSSGQKQLICLARALLRRSRILILDEATAAIDFETDKFVQDIIRQEFADCTVITIAHRINTIMDSNRVLVMDEGRIREFDSPENLLDRPESLFYKLAEDAGAA